MKKKLKAHLLDLDNDFKRQIAEANTRLETIQHEFKELESTLVTEREQLLANQTALKALDDKIIAEKEAKNAAILQEMEADLKILSEKIPQVNFEWKSNQDYSSQAGALKDTKSALEECQKIGERLGKNIRGHLEHSEDSNFTRQIQLFSEKFTPVGLALEAKRQTVNRSTEEQPQYEKYLPLYHRFFGSNPKALGGMARESLQKYDKEYWYVNYFQNCLRFLLRAWNYKTDRELQEEYLCFLQKKMQEAFPDKTKLERFSELLNPQGNDQTFFKGKVSLQDSFKRVLDQVIPKPTPPVQVEQVQPPLRP